MFLVAYPNEGIRADKRYARTDCNRELELAETKNELQLNTTKVVALAKKATTHI